MLVVITVLFIIGYLLIALEHPLRIDKTATALLLGMVLWIIYAIGAETLVPAVNGEELQEFLAKSSASLQQESLAHQCLNFILSVKIVEHMGDISQTLFFLIGAMTIVELIDIHGGFSVITDHINTRKKRKLLCIVACIAFILSAILDNLTTTIVMVMLLRKLINDQHERWVYASMVVIAANTGGAWSPIGDITTIMLWVKGNVTTSALISFVLLPSIVAMAIPLLITSRKLIGDLPEGNRIVTGSDFISPKEKKTIFFLGVCGLIFVPIFKSITHLPPFVGILFVLSILWIFTEILYNKKMLEKTEEHRVPQVISRIDMPSILFFLGILMAVAVLQSTGILASVAGWLDQEVHNVYLISIVLGVLSSIVDNVPLVAAAMGMYPISDPGTIGYMANFVQDGTFWEFLSYCAGVGGSMLIIGSAAGVVAMGLEKINFGWYLKHFSWIALLGYLAGAGVYVLETMYLKPLL
ncbi:MAG: sodium:proton antiporter NhaD [Porphyromonadaceae bacterium]|nr:sodium:proton antiporter NhaD [Porphyromonadaceae bacterium]